MITDQLGRAMLQFDVVLSAIVTPIETGLAAMGIQVPAVITTCTLTVQSFTWRLTADS